MLLLAGVCGGVASAEESIEVISEPNESVLDLEEIDKEKKDAEEKKAENKAGAEQSEQVKGDEAPKDVEEVGKELPVEVVPAEVGSPLGAAKASITLTAYGNVSPTNQYAVYSQGLLKEVPLDGHYVFMQDSATSYVFVAGQGDSLAALSDASWWRWYNAGVSRGWVLERGSGSVSVRDGDYTVLSDLEGYPGLQDSGIEQIRREVAFYALVLAVAHVLYSVWTYELRGGKRGLG